MIVTPLGDSTVSPAFDSSTLPPSAEAAMSTMTEPDFILPTASAVTSSGGLRPGHLGGRDDDVHAADDLVELGLLGGPLLGASARGRSRRRRSHRSVVLSLTNWAPRLSACSRVSGRTS